jgi:hypothetical protein
MTVPNDLAHTADVAAHDWQPGSYHLNDRQGHVLRECPMNKDLSSSKDGRHVLRGSGPAQVSLAVPDQSEEVLLRAAEVLDLADDQNSRRLERPVLAPRAGHRFPEPVIMTLRQQRIGSSAEEKASPRSSTTPKRDRRR